MPRTKKSSEEKEVTITIRVSPELLEVFEKMRKQLNNLTYDAMGNVSYNELSKILARKVKEKELY